MSAFAADDPSAPPDAVWNFMLAVWSIFACYVALIVAGLIGGWLGYRNRRNRLSFWFSTLAAGPILLTLLAFLAFVVTSFVWTASIQAPVPTIP